MWNIMKAQNYQIRGDNLFIYVLLIGLLLPTGCILMDFGFNELSGSIFMAQLGGVMPMVLCMVHVILISRICGWDAVDKTMNYEIMAGHSRAEVYFGRIAVSMIWGLASGMLLILLPVFAITMINGWGDGMNVMDAMACCALALFPMFRLICEVALLTFLLQNCYAAMLLGWIFFEITFVGGMIYQEFTDKSFTVQLASYNLSWVFDFSNYKLVYIGGEDVPVYDTVINSSMAVSTVLVSLLVGGACLAIGYALFRKQDMN